MCDDVEATLAHDLGKLLRVHSDLPKSHAVRNVRSLSGGKVIDNSHLESTSEKEIGNV